MITAEQLQQWRGLAEAATPGPLTYDGHHIYSGAVGEWRPHAFFENTADAALYSAAREAVPALLAEVERLCGELNTATAAIANLRTIWRNGGASDRTMARLSEAFRAYDAARSALAEQEVQP